MDADVKWFFAYCEANVRWMRFINVRLRPVVRAHRPVRLLPFRLMEGEVDSAWPAIPDGIEVGNTTARGAQQLFTRLEKTRPRGVPRGAGPGAGAV